MAKFERSRVVPGAEGFGKVKIIYKEPKKRWILPRLIGSIIYLSFFFILFVSFSWSRPYLKFNVSLSVIKALKSALGNTLSFIQTLQTNSSIYPSSDISISASNASTALFDQGFVHGSHRLFQMEIYRRAACGNLSSVIGAKTMYHDIFARTMQFCIDVDVSENVDGAAGVDSVVLSLLQAYTDGVNLAITKQNQQVFPPDFYFTFGIFSSIQIVPWEVKHSLAIFRLLQYSHTVGWEDNLLFTMLESTIGIGKVQAILPKQRSSLSHKNFLSFPSLSGLVIAIPAALSKTGKAMFGFNFYSQMKHQGFWQYMKLSCPEFTVEGITFPGIPFVLMGQIEAISWVFLPEAKQNDREQVRIVKSEKVLAPSAFTERKELIQSYYDRNNIEITVLQDENNHIDISHLLSSTLTSITMQQNIRHIFVPSLPTLPHSLHFLSSFYHLNSAISDESMRIATENGCWQDAGLQLFFANHNDGTVGVISPSTSTNPPNTFTIMVSNQTIIAGDDVHISAELSRKRKWSNSDLQAVLNDDYSPAGKLFGNDLYEFLLNKRDAKSVKIRSLLKDFNGSYHGNLIQPTIIEAFRMHFLFHLLNHPLKGMADAMLGGNQSAVLRPSVINTQKLVPSDLLPSKEHRIEDLERIAGKALLLAEAGGYDLVMDSAWTETISWCEEHYGTDMQQWLWQYAHETMQPHVKYPMSEVVDAVLAYGPEYGRGGLDSNRRMSYMNHVNVLSKSMLKSVDAISTAFSFITNGVENGSLDVIFVAGGDSEIENKQLEEKKQLVEKKIDTVQQEASPDNSKLSKGDAEL